MASKRKSSAASDPNQIRILGKPGEDEATAIARTVLEPTMQAAVTLKQYDRYFGDMDLPGLIDSLTEQTTAASDGDTQRAEEMLVSQAHTLDAIFHNLARKAINTEYVDNLDRYLKLALRAQSQCRATWEAVSTIKHPPMMGYVHQANIAHGHQQVNNGTQPPDTAPRAREDQNLQNKLLEETDGKRLDAGTASTPSRVDTAMATMGKVDGTED